MRLLLVEDDEMVGASLQRALEKNAFGVDWVQDGEAALLSLHSNPYSAAIIDINLPKISGLAVVKDMRSKKNAMPVLLLTARDSHSQKIEGLDSGADDYLVKPFDLGELMARLRALQRRSEGRIENVLRIGAVELDPSATTVCKEGEIISVTAKEFRVLKLLMERAGKYLTKRDIEYAIYSTDTSVESNTVEVTIYSLRRKLGNEFIRNIRGVGYMVGA